MSFSFELISHPDRTLKEHLDRCNDISFKLLEMKHISNSFFTVLELEYWRKLLVYFHDFGKASFFFQKRIIDASIEKNITSFINDNTEYFAYFEKEKRKQIEKLMYEDASLSHHARIGSYMLFNNKISDNEIIKMILFKIVLKHHGNMTNFLTDKENKSQAFLDSDRLEHIEKQLENTEINWFNQIIEPKGLHVEVQKWPEIKAYFSKLRTFSKIENRLTDEKSYKYFFLQHFLYSLVLSADKGDVMLEKGSNFSNFIRENTLFPNDLVDNYKTIEFKNKDIKAIDIERERAYKDIMRNCEIYGDNNFFSITLPTGLGKTLSAYNAAIFLQQKYKTQTGKTPHIIYCLPFTSIIDQNAMVLSEIVEKYNGNLPETLIARHHYLSDYNDKYDEKELSYEEGEYMTEGWEHDFIITTFVQLFESIFTNKNKAIRKFHNITNSVIILDEVQNVPPKFYEIIEEVFVKMAEYFNTKFIFVTATQPIIFTRNSVIELTDPTKQNTKKYFTSRNRIELNQKLLIENDFQPIEIEKCIEIFKNDIEEQPDKSFLIICNTIAQSQQVYDAISIYADESKENRTYTLYLSGSILPVRRKTLIKLIQRNIKCKYRQIIVSTQVVEAGVDIDLDIVYRDFAPLDSINQSSGRCNRNGIRGKGTVKLFHTGKCKYIYDSCLLDITKNILKQFPDIIPESKFYELNQMYFEQVKTKISESSNETINLRKYIYNLQLENIAKEFVLIREQNYYYNVFIPYCKKADKVWKEYINCVKIQEDFERKKAIKKIKPRLLQYVTRFPNNKYEPNPDDKEKSIIRENDWENYYNLKSGFKLNDHKVIII